MTIGHLNYQGGLQIDHGTLNLTGQNVYFVPPGSSQPQTDPLGLYLPSAFWGTFGSFQNVNLSASSGLVEFTGNISLSAQNSFSINAAAIKAVSAAGNVGDAINAPTISLLNHGCTPGSPSLQNVNSLSLNANEIYVGEGALLLDGFASVNFYAVHDITFRGSGSLNTAGNLLLLIGSHYDFGLRGCKHPLHGRKLSNCGRWECHDRQERRPAGHDFGARRDLGDNRCDNRRLRDRGRILGLHNVYG